MKPDERIPSEVHDDYWIFAFNQENNYKVEIGESGKWLIFEHENEIDSTWLKIKKATEEGLLGQCSKVSTAKINPNAESNEIKVICIYTADYENMEDINRIEANIRNIGIDNKLIYKLDRDVGKYRKDGKLKISQSIRFSKKYYEILNWLETHPKTKHITFLGVNKWGKKRYCFERIDMKIEDYKAKKIVLGKIGFFIEKKSEKVNEKFYFSG